MANINVANLKPPKAPNLPIPPNAYSQEYQNVLTNTLRLYFNQIDVLCRYMINPDIGYYLNCGYGGFSSDVTQTATTINTPTAVTFNTTDIHDINLSLLNGNPDIYIDPTDASAIVILFPAIYNFQFSLQLTSNSSSAKNVWIWPRINGVDTPNSATKITLAGSSHAFVAAWNWVLETLAPGDFFQLMWATDDLAVQITAEPTVSFAPAIPSAILTVSAVSA